MPFGTIEGSNLELDIELGRLSRGNGGVTYSSISKECGSGSVCGWWIVLEWGFTRKYWLLYARSNDLST